MTFDERIKEIKERLEKATPGPWYYYGQVGWNGIAIGTAPEDPPKISGKGYPHDGDDDFNYNVVGVNYEHFSAKDEDCELIANAPSDIAFLLEWVEIARSALETFADKNRYDDDGVFSFDWPVKPGLSEYMPGWAYADKILGKFHSEV